MLAFFEASWAFWWLLAIVAILRWFHLLTTQSEISSENVPPRRKVSRLQTSAQAATVSR